MLRGMDAEMPSHPPGVVARRAGRGRRRHGVRDPGGRVHPRPLLGLQRGGERERGVQGARAHRGARRTRSVLEDLSSSNGTFVNGTRCARRCCATRTPSRLANVAKFKVVIEHGEVGATGPLPRADLRQEGEQPKFSGEWKTPLRMGSGRAGRHCCRRRRPAASGARQEGQAEPPAGPKHRCVPGRGQEGPTRGRTRRRAQARGRRAQGRAAGAGRGQTRDPGQREGRAPAGQDRSARARSSQRARRLRRARPRPRAPIPPRRRARPRSTRVRGGSSSPIVPAVAPAAAPRRAPEARDPVSAHRRSAAATPGRGRAARRFRRAGSTVVDTPVPVIPSSPPPGTPVKIATARFSSEKFTFDVTTTGRFEVGRSRVHRLPRRSHHRVAPARRPHLERGPRPSRRRGPRGGERHPRQRPRDQGARRSSRTATCSSWARSGFVVRFERA